MRIVMGLVVVVSVIMVGRQIASPFAITVISITARLAILVVSLVEMRVRGCITIIIMQTMLATIVVVAISMLLTGHLLIIGVVFLVAVAAISRIVARAVA